MRTVLLAALLVVGACSASPATTTESVPTPADELAAAADALAASPSFTVSVVRDGDPLPIEAVAGLGVESIDGRFVAPDRVEGQAGARLGPLAAPVDYVAIGDDVWLANPLSGEWERYSADETIDLPAILGADGLPRFVAEDTTEVVYETVDGVDGYRATFDTTRLSEVSNGAVGAGVTALRGAVDGDGVLALVVFGDPVDTAVTWRFTFDEIGVEGPDIVPPA